MCNTVNKNTFVVGTVFVVIVALAIHPVLEAILFYSKTSFSESACTNRKAHFVGFLTLIP